MSKMIKTLAILILIFGITATFSIQVNENQNSNQASTPFSSVGTSSVSLNTTSITVAQNTSYHVSYKVTLISGSTWGTFIESSGPSNISISFSKSEGDPTFSGTATVSPTSSANIGNYSISFKATGDDPSTNTVVLNVSIIKGKTVTTSPTPTPPPTKSSPPPPSTNYIPYIAGAVVIALFFVTIGITSLIGGEYSRRLNLVSSILALGSSIYLLAYDSLLRITAYYHWMGLFAYVILTILALILSYSLKKFSKLIFLGIFVGNILMGLLMISDTVAGLPVSNYYNASSNIGWNYLFGFGTTGISLFSISLAFSILLIMAGISAGTAFYVSRGRLSSKSE